jgi:ATP-binding cassette subfamily B protein
MTLMRGRTVVAIAHRLSTVTSFDRIVVLAEGQIVEDSPPSILMRRGGMFESLWSLQSASFEHQP